ncbi:MAG TPA: hypothetical protein VFA66_12330 [Gaiellaceae bacterium]|nr:hypothetical protein [Gaiellaceae bacterium]
MSGLVIAAVAPHGGIAVAELCGPDEVGLAAATRAGLEELGRRFRAAEPDTAVVVTPHNVHVEGVLAVVVAGELAGSVEEGGRAVSLECPVDVDLALALRRALGDAGIPAVCVGYGSNRLHEASMPLDWGALVPLWFLGGRRSPPLPVVLVSPARDLPPALHVEAGRALATAAAGSGKRIALIASADHGHAHDPGGPYGCSAESAVYDEHVVRATRAGTLERLLDLDPALVEAAQADSWWQLLVLHGALGDGFEAELLSYEAPTYFGMMCACFTPKPS